MALDDPMLNEFLSEAKEHLANVTDDLLALEKVSPDTLRYRIDRLFRAMHSIKGAAGFFGFVHITELAHLMETLLRRLREQSLRPDESQLDSLLAGSDLILTLLDDVQRSNEVDIRAVRDQLERQVSGGVVQLTERQPVSRSLTVGQAASLSLTPAQPHEYKVVVDLTAFCQQRQQPPLVLIRLLLTFGTLRDGRLEVADHDLTHSLPPGPLIFHAVLSSSLNLEQLCSATGLTNEQILWKAEGESGKEQIKPLPEHPSPLRQPPSETPTLRINVALLDRLMNLAGELVLVRNQALQAIDPTTSGVSPATRRILQRLNAVTSDLQETVLRTRMQPIGNVFNKFPRLIRDLARSLGKEVDLVLEGQEVELDKSILEMLSDPLTHLIRNCCDHGIESPAERRLANKPETGVITLTARHEGSQIHIRIRDDGKGIDADKVRRKALQMGVKTADELASLGGTELLSLILLPGFSTADRITDVSGRGVGMDVVRTNVEKLGGTLDIDSEPGQGTQFTLRLPLTVAIIPCLLVTAGADRFAIPQKDLEELVTLFPHPSSGQLEYAFDQEVYRLRDQLLPLVRLNEVLARTQPFTPAVKAAIMARYRTKQRIVPDITAPPGAPISIVVVKAGRHRYGLIVDRILTTEEVVVKPMQSSLKTLRCYSGATILGDGRVALILELEVVARHANLSFDRLPDAPPAPTTDDRDAQTVLLFRSGPLEQFAVALPMIRRVVAFGGKAAREQPLLDRIDLIDQVGGREFVTLAGVTTRLLRLDRLLPVSAAPANEVGYLILPRNVHKPIAVLATQILDTVELSTQLDTDGIQNEGILGTAVVRGRLTLVLDLFRLVDRLEGKARLATSGASLVARDGPGPARQRRVLLVEDTQFFRLLVKGYLEDQGFEVVTASNGALGLEMLETQQFDLIVSDIEMPVLDGWGFAKAVRERPQSRRLPMLALSTLSSPADRERALRCGFDRYEVKLERDRFLEAVQQLLAAPPVTR
jgi:two-component system chemotaxis sensor kinase CheA